MTTNKPNLSSSDILSSGLFLASVSAYTYLISYAYEWGYCLAFEMPNNFISLTPTTMILAAISVALVLAFAVGIGFFFMPFLKAFDTSRHPEFSITACSSIALFVILFIDALLTSSFKTLLVKMLLFFGITLFVSLFLAYLLSKRKESLLSRGIKAATNAWTENQPLLIAYSSFGHRKTLIAIFALMMIAQAGLLGGVIGQNKAVFYMLGDREDYVLLRTYGDNLVTAKFDAQTHSLTGDYEVRRLSEENDIILKRVRTGKLTPARLDSAHEH